jgi:hypothetical protein
MPTDTFASLAHRFDQFADGLSDPTLRKVMTEIGVAAKGIATGAASADLGGDPKFSGWAPILETRFDHVGEGRISFHPTRKAAGPWTVAEYGRNSTAGPRMVGPRLTKTGKVSKAKQKRWNGRTQGKGTASAATAAIDKMTPQLADDAVKRAIRKAFD